MREENARLRTQEQSALDPHRVAAWLRADPSSTDSATDTAIEDLTDVQDRQLQIELARQGLLSVCERLNVLSAQLRRQLSHGIPAPEIDRRVRGRRAADGTEPTDPGTGPGPGAAGPRNRSAPGPMVGGGSGWEYVVIGEVLEYVTDEAHTPAAAHRARDGGNAHAGSRHGGVGHG